jgi:hypothetical protein
MSGARVIVPRDDYACVRKGGSELVMTGSGDVGVMRPDGFHPVTEAGIGFHRQMGDGSPIAAFV